jgi:nucleotide-binding universal stress UspA family protein
MGLITNILFPVDFSSSCVAMGPYVKRAAEMFGARVSLLHVFDPASYTGWEGYVRGPVEIAEEHRQIAQRRFDDFLAKEFPVSHHPRILAKGDPAKQIAETARHGFDFIMMPTHSGTFRRTLLGSTTAKVLNDVDCPVATSRHAETIAPRPMEHREWLCAIGLSEDSERVLRFAMQAATEVGAHLRIIHAIQSTDPSLPVRLDLEEEIQSAEVREAIERVGALQRRVGSNASLRITVGPVKEALIEAIRQSDADTLMIGRIARSGLQGRLRDLTYALVRDSPVPVTSV